MPSRMVPAAAAAAAILAPVAVPAAAAAAAAVDSTAAAAGTVAGGAAGVEEVCSGRKNEVIGRVCTAAVEAVVEGAEVLVTAFCSPSTFTSLDVSIWGVSRRTERVCCVCSLGKCCITPVIGKGTT